MGAGWLVGWVGFFVSVGWFCGGFFDLCISFCIDFFSLRIPCNTETYGQNLSESFDAELKLTKSPLHPFSMSRVLLPRPLKSLT